MTPTDAELIEWLRLCDTAYKLHAPAVAEGQRLAADRLAELKELNELWEAQTNTANALVDAVKRDRDEAEAESRRLTKEVERLTDLADLRGALLDDAKAESDRLRAELTIRVDGCQLENKRLRGALGVYADEKNWHCTEIGEYHEHSERCCKDGWWTRNDNGYDIAREALKEPNE